MTRILMRPDLPLELVTEAPQTTPSAARLSLISFLIVYRLTNSGNNVCTHMSRYPVQFEVPTG